MILDIFHKLLNTKLCCGICQGWGKVLDLGCGSGILSIVAKKLNASKVDMTDIDPAAIEAVYDNFKVNKLSMDNVKVEAGNVLEDEKMQAELCHAYLFQKQCPDQFQSSSYPYALHLLLPK